MKRCKSLIFLLLLSFNLTVHAEGLTLSERFKAAELLETSVPIAALPLYQELAEQNYTEAKVRLAAARFFVVLKRSRKCLESRILNQVLFSAILLAIRVNCPALLSEIIS